MKYQFSNKEALFNLVVAESTIQKNYFGGKKGSKNYALVWNNGEDKTIQIDDSVFVFKQHSILPIMLDQSYEFKEAHDFVCWQFNSEFYCIVNHDAEVGCVGFLFYGLHPVNFIQFNEIQTQELQQLTEAFKEEFVSNEEIKEEMLRMMLVNLIIKVTRVAKKQFISKETTPASFELIRQFNFLVEEYYKKEKSVQFYAMKLHKSPKTISNIFSRYSNKTPLEIIHNRIILEAKRLFYFTDKSIKEIAYELGFEDAAVFSKFFKKQTSQTPSSLKKPIIPSE